MTTSSLATADFVPLEGGRRGYYALPAGTGPFPGVLLFQEAFGVNDYIQSEVRRLAAHGYAALAPDLFRGDTYEYGDMEKVMARLATLKDEDLLADVDAGIAFLRGQAAVGGGALGAVGFCMGGRLAYLSAATRGSEIRAAVSFYGGGIAPAQARHFPPVIDRAAGIQGALLMIYGADDAGIAPDEHARICEALSTLKKNYGIRVFPGAGHGFASKNRESYRPAQAEAAWTETLEFFARELTVVP